MFAAFVQSSIIRLIPVGMVILAIQRALFVEHTFLDVKLQLVLAFVAACGVASGVAPMELALNEYEPAMRRQLALARRFPWLIRVLLWHATGRHYTKDFETARAAFEAGFEKAAEPDRALEDDPGNALTVRMLREAFRQGLRGPSYEGRLLVQDWGFRLEDILHARVHLWHGDKDSVAPPAGARAVAQRIPNCEATFLPGEAHSSTVVNHAETMLRTLVQR